MDQRLTGFEGQTIEDQKSKQIKTIEDLEKKLLSLPPPSTFLLCLKLPPIRIIGILKDNGLLKKTKYITGSKKLPYTAQLPNQGGLLQVQL